LLQRPIRVNSGIGSYAIALAGEKVLYDVKRMEMAYHDLNVREYELTKHVS
jgi:hypothetical protein